MARSRSGMTDEHHIWLKVLQFGGMGQGGGCQSLAVCVEQSYRMSCIEQRATQRQQAERRQMFMRDTACR